MDIRAGAGYPSGALSNFAPHPFKLDDVACMSMEGFLQALKFDKEHIQVEVCKLVGKAAKARGSKRSSTWQRTQTLWWKGTKMARKGPEYQELLDRAYKAMFEQSDSFRKALQTTGNGVLTHSLGKNKECDTVLTEREFCSRLMKLRDGTLK